MDNTVKKVLIVAGEASGDQLGARLVSDLRAIAALQHSGMALQFYGVVGEEMLTVGVEPIFHITDIAVIGFQEVILSIPRIMYKMHNLMLAVDRLRPNLIVTIDAPGFNLRFIKKVRHKFGNRIKIIHYVAPTVWAYNKNRAHVIGQLFDHIMLLLPFEQQYFSFMPHTFVGHPIVVLDKAYKMRDEHGRFSQIGHQKRLELGIKNDDLLITIMPGSREGEILRHLPILKVVMQNLQLEYAKAGRLVKFCIPTIKQLEDKLRKTLPQNNNIIIISHEHERKRYAIAASDLALVKSGTGVLEVATLGTPMVAFYKLSFITEWFLKHKLNIRFVTLPNLLLNKEVIPEFLAQNCCAEKITNSSITLLNENRKKMLQIKNFARVVAMLNGDDINHRIVDAADVVMRYLN